MSLLPDSASFEEQVQDCFLVFRGSGLMLSALDYELLSEWAQLGIPVEVVARGIRKAAEKALWDARPEDRGLRNLRACKRSVQTEIRRYLDRAAGRRTEREGAAVPGDEPLLSLDEERAKRLAKLLRKLAADRPELQPAITRLLERTVGQRFEDSALLEARIEAALLRALPFPVRLPLLRDAARLTREACCTSARARLLSGRFHRGAVLRRALELPSFW